MSSLYGFSHFPAIPFQPIGYKKFLTPASLNAAKTFKTFCSATMFAVPGWSISADALKTQTVSNTSKAATVHKPDHLNDPGKKKSRKRKRGHGSSSALELTDENLGDLWRKHIEEKNFDQTQQHEKKVKKRNQINGAKADVLEEIENVDEGSFEGFSEEDQGLVSTEKEAPQKQKQRKRIEQDYVGTVQANSGEDATETSTPLLKEPESVEDGKSKYEQRKAKAAKKREQRAILQASGALPPSRPEKVSSHPTKNTPASPTQIAKPSKSSKAPDKPHQPITTEHKNPSRAPEPSESSRAPDTTQTTPLPLPSTKLTPLQQRMAAKLTSARFRHLNQTLYTSPSEQAMRLFADSPQNYTSYHAGFRAQVAVWPQNPVECFIEDIKARAAVSVPSQKKLWREQKKGKKSKGSSSNGDATAGSAASTVQAGVREKVDSLPRFPTPHGTCTIADLGCGDATLAGSLLLSAKSLNLNILSFDLAKGDSPHANFITVADIANLSAADIKNESVDIAICCLSLMGTNWVDIVNECARIVRRGGEVWVAEIKSRFGRVGEKKKTRTRKVEGGIGRKKGAAGKGKGKDEEDDENEAMALEDIDDVKSEGGKDETDVAAFVEVFRKRGLVLKGAPDMANKMFVRMRFVKSLVDAGRMEKNGKRKRDSEGNSKMYAKTTRFVEDDDGDEMVDESKVLKPCVYKTR